MQQLNFISQVFVSFGAGFLSFFSACIVPLVPAYICFITGLSFDELNTVTPQNLRHKKIILTESLLFIAGFSLVFILLGASVSFLGAYFFAKQHIIKMVGAVIIIIFGVHMMGFFRIRFLEYEKKIHLKNKPLVAWGSFLVGMAFGFGWTPCVGPILGGILLLAASKESLLQGTVLLTFYSLGLAVPFFLVSLGVGRAVALFTKIKKYFRIFSIASGVVLIGIGLYVLFIR